ncbi:hypothetical protein HZA33_00480, partial [Candidatus Pacearchaeota archaeon]|nr:hypothetical protein [Candidatus Pacearchaeota archaeon]
MLKLEEGSKLVKLGREAIESNFSHKQIQKIKEPKFMLNAGCFVSLHLYPS